MKLQSDIIEVEVRKPADGSITVRISSSKTSADAARVHAPTASSFTARAIMASAPATAVGAVLADRRERQAGMPGGI